MIGCKISISLFYKLFAVPTYLFGFKIFQQQPLFTPSIFYIYQACYGSDSCIRIKLQKKKKLVESQKKMTVSTEC